MKRKMEVEIMRKVDKVITSGHLQHKVMMEKYVELAVRRLQIKKSFLWRMIA